MEPYLTDVGRATSERHRWQLKYEKALAKSIAKHIPDSLTAAGKRRKYDLPPWWGKVTEDLMHEAAEGTREEARAIIHDLAPSTEEREIDPQDLARKIAPTLATVTFNHHVVTRLAYFEIPLKMWVTRRDDRVREAHNNVDGQIRTLARPFNVRGFRMQVPGDRRTAPMDLWIGCRCAVVGRKDRRHR